MLSLIGIALAPIVLILIYVYRRDRYEKEPRIVLIKSFILGALTVIPILFIEIALSNYWEQKYTLTNQMIKAAYDAFIVAAGTEETFKYLAFIILIWRSKNFNEKFDGIVYAAYISLGFAAVENILYVFQHGMQTGFIRAVTAVPAHTIFGVTMGYFLAMAKFKNSNFFFWIFLSISVPVVLHGFYDFILMSGNNILLILFIPFLIAILILALKQMKFLSGISRFKPNT
jgi:RsiW-degrading membrane proteinase PrsW (M82 family)